MEENNKEQFCSRIENKFIKEIRETNKITGLPIQKIVNMIFEKYLKEECENIVKKYK